jgi:uncharacterized flavoprotein (TIGR03862 family)
MTDPAQPTCAVIGGGPAGLMAAEMLSARGVAVTVYDAMPSLGRKFLMAGKSGLNLTKDEPPAAFRAAYGAAPLDAALSDFGPEAVQDWARGLGQPLFTGSTGRVFPQAMKASPLLRAWLRRLDGAGVRLRPRWRWTGWENGALAFDTVDGPQHVTADATVLALGGASWRRLGSDGAWADLLAARGIPIAPFRPANVGLRIRWSAHMAPHLGAPLKSVAFRAGNTVSRGEAVLSAEGLEGGGIYTVSAAVRDGAALHIDLRPDLDQKALADRLAKPRGKASIGNFLRRAAGLDPVKLALLNELARPLPAGQEALARTIKALPVPVARLADMDGAISTAGGVPFAALDEGLMLTDLPGTFCAGEMLDWEAPTGGYLLTGCLATGRRAGIAAAEWLNAPTRP